MLKVVTQDMAKKLEIANYELHDLSIVSDGVRLGIYEDEFRARQVFYEMLDAELTEEKMYFMPER